MNIYTSRQTKKKRNTVYAVSAVCGGGKTEAALNYIAANVDKKNFVYIVPTNALGESVFHRLRAKHESCNIRFITGNGSVSGVAKYFNKPCSSSGNVLIVNWACWKYIDHLHQLKQKMKTFQVIIDEIPPLVNNQFYIPKSNFVFLRELVMPAKEHSVDHVRLLPVDIQRIKKKLKNGDIPDESYQFFQDLTNENFHMFVDCDHWEAMLKHKHDEDLQCVSMANPKPFKGAVLMGANLEQSLLYDWLGRYYKINFDHNHPITKGIKKAHSPDLAEKVTVKFCRHKNFSKYMMEDESGKWNHVTSNLNIDDMTRLIKEDMAANGLDTKSYGFTANADFEDKPFDTSLATNKKAVYIPPKAHGLNDYQYLNTMVNLCAMNPTKEYQALMGSLGFTYEQLRYDMMIDPFYQWVMRSGARSESPEGQYVFYAPDYATASAVSALTGATLEFIGGDVFPNEEPVSDQDRKSKSRSNKFLLEYELPINDKNGHEFLIKHFFKEQRDTFCNSVGSLPTHHVHLGMVHSIKGYLPHHVLDLTYDRASFIIHMKKFAKVKTSKENAYKIIPSWFRRDTGENGFREKANVLAVHSMILDIDGGTYSIQDFIDQFGKKFSFMIHSTANCGDDMTRFRVVLPYIKPCSVVEHDAVYEWFESRMAGAKLDASSRSGVGVFTLPFTGDDGEPFLEFFNMKRDSQLNKRLNPEDIKRLTPTVKPLLPKGKTKNKEIDVEALKSELRAMTEDRRKPFYVAVRKMERAGYSEHEIRYQLKPIENEMDKDGWIDEALKQINRYEKAA